MSIQIPVALAEEIIAAHLTPLRAEVARLADEVRQLRRAMPPLLVTQREAAKTLGVSLSTIQRKVKSGEVPSVRVGKSVRVDLAAVRPLGAEEVARLAREARPPPLMRAA
jgi:excisionase family DNA binding protein